MPAQNSGGLYKNQRAGFAAADPYRIFRKGFGHCALIETDLAMRRNPLWGGHQHDRILREKKA
jgi:hypothetical protein